MAKDRTINKNPQLLGRQISTNGQGDTVYTQHFATLPLRQRLDISYGNPRIDGHYTGGKEFVARSAGFQLGTLNRVNADRISTGTIKRGYSGNLVPTGIGQNPTMPALPASTALDLQYWGTKAYSRFKPTNAVVDFGQLIGELYFMRDAGRSLEQRAQDIRRGRADKLHNSNVLDEAFGMGAIARDLKKLLHLREELAKAIRQLERDNGKPVRRRGIVNIVESSSVNRVVGANGQYTRPSFTSQHYQSGWNAEQITRVQESTTYWFSGRFRYYIPDLPDGNDWNHSVVRRLLGLGTHPASLIKLAFNLGPWLWLISWATTMADILSNVESAAVDNLTNDYAFIMGSFERKTTVESSVFFRTDQPRWFSAEKIETIKARSRASPYGFNLTDGLTDRQIYILGHLGAQKALK